MGPAREPVLEGPSLGKREPRATMAMHGSSDTLPLSSHPFGWALMIRPRWERMKQGLVLPFPSGSLSWTRRLKICLLNTF